MKSMYADDEEEYDPRLMPGPEGKIPRFYEVDRGNKTESYITAVTSNPIHPKYPGPGYEQVPPAEEEDDQPDGNRVGLTERQLRKYRDDPVWKAIRRVLFVACCLLWLLLFLAVIFLVFLSSKCEAIEGPNWWQTTVAYNIWVPSFQDSDGDGYGDIKGVIDRMEHLRKSGVQTIWPNPLLASSDFSLAVNSHHEIDPRLGAVKQTDELIETIRDKGMKLVISLPVATTSLQHQWFQNSASASKPENQNFSQFYIWASKSSDSSYFAPHKNLFYLHEFNNSKAAVLNWQDEHVQKQIKQVLSDWIERGIDGFYLTDVEYLARSPNGTEPDWSGIRERIREIRRHVDAYTRESVTAQGKKIALFASRDDAKERDKKELVESGLDTVINYELSKVEKNSKICHKNEGSIAYCVYEILSDVLRFHLLYPQVWPQWQLGDAFTSRIATRVESRAQAEALLLVQLVVPGTINVYYGDEIGMTDLPDDRKVPKQRGQMQWTAEGGFSSSDANKIPVNTDVKNINWERQYSQTTSSLKMFRRVAKLRLRDETLKRGTTLVGQLVKGAFTITRFIEGDNSTSSNIYTVAVNFSPKSITLPLDDFPSYNNLEKAAVIN
ncbi:hypothetical protein WR25_08559 [Diploscapter pachys]|uniref:alpha-glucosidase n=1 Tax=Diploscapter pachys TaxID=2018661 RepID=A0A2A2JL50_9BILA|nr:hypothetical protein WR25_08559 [Diploscapter pachys]